MSRRGDGRGALLAGALGGLALVTALWPRLALGNDRLWVFAVVAGALAGFLAREGVGRLRRRRPPRGAAARPGEARPAARPAPGTRPNWTPARARKEASRWRGSARHAR
ncbi:MAG TPA: hypothetical protein VFW96_22500 [Thermomicrobiales bacterium]|nr:hypothetical protein [Thermomicrobiales bacterium]